ncbi:acid protease [Russula earlei]|uniref:Acid protease n=1 Tax=Russula earlei TaxID=71964 RepID=A0ACC0U6A6_9AGAM|nr:acid protease [Russula earlei]
MRPLWSSILFAASLHANWGSLAVHIDLPPRSASSIPDLLARQNGVAGLNDTGISYYLDITLGGRPFTVLIDTGSSDLWVSGTVPNANDTGISATIPYAVGSDSGPVKTADLNIVGYSVPSQAYIEVTPSNLAPDGTGLIGLGPSSGSIVLAAMNTSGSAGDPVIDNVFRQNVSVPNFISFLLNRPNDTFENYTSEFTISEILPSYQNITNQPKLPVSVLESQISFAQHFSVLLDPDGIIGPDGKPIQTTSNTSFGPTHNPNQLQLAIDSGFTEPQFPEYIVDAIYSGIQGAQLVNNSFFHGPVWVFGCDVEVNVTLKFGGLSYPLHPLDLSRQAIDDNGNEFCHATLQAVIPGAYNPTLDGIMGMAILSNMYVLLNYGDFIDGSTSNTSAPYVQLLSTTDPAEAHSAFVAERLGGNDTTGPQNKSNNNNSNNNISGTSTGFFQKNKIPIIIAGVAVVGGAVLVGAVLVARRRKSAYRPLHDPAPGGDLAMQSVAGYNAGARYADPWTTQRS